MPVFKCKNCNNLTAEIGIVFCKNCNKMTKLTADKETIVLLGYNFLYRELIWKNLKTGKYIYELIER